VHDQSLGKTKETCWKLAQTIPWLKHAHTSVWKCKGRSPNIAKYPTLIVGKLRAWFKFFDQVSRDQNLPILSYFYTIGNLLKIFRRSFVICFMHLMKLFLIMNCCVRTLLIACFDLQMMHSNVFELTIFKRKSNYGHHGDPKK
jgi:hypothetical protein